MTHGDYSNEAIINSENTDSCFIRTIYDIVPIPINRDLYSHIELYRSIITYRDRIMEQMTV